MKKKWKSVLFGIVALAAVVAGWLCQRNCSGSRQLWGGYLREVGGVPHAAR